MVKKNEMLAFMVGLWKLRDFFKDKTDGEMEELYHKKVEEHKERKFTLLRWVAQNFDALQTIPREHLL